ncbi:MAG: Hsp20/alpha crystallin family protein [Candidatus Odinarchaeia archaeon]
MFNRRKDKIYDYFIEKIQEIEEQINKLYWDMFEAKLEYPSWDPTDKYLEPLIELEETDDYIVVRADLPMVNKEDIQINCTDTTLEITAKFKKNVRFEKWGTVQREMEFCKFYKLIELPARVNPEGGSAKLVSGVLEIKLPKKRAEYKINIK